ncbi:MAG: hypothetical protein U1F43_23585 [Myxococcota bacterium]
MQVGLALGYAASPGVRVELRAAMLPRPVLVLDGRDVWGAWPVSLGLALLGLAP